MIGGHRMACCAGKGRYEIALGGAFFWYGNGFYSVLELRDL